MGVQTTREKEEEEGMKREEAELRMEIDAIIRDEIQDNINAVSYTHLRAHET